MKCLVKTVVELEVEKKSSFGCLVTKLFILLLTCEITLKGIYIYIYI